MIDNANLIKPFLKYSSDDDFYAAEIIKRRKENPDMPAGTKLIDSYHIYEGEFDELYPKLQDKAALHNARIYIQLNKKSARMVALRAMKKMAENIERGDYKACKRAYQSAVGETNAASRDEKVWLIDLDPEHLPLMDKIVGNIESCDPTAILTKIPTINGVHLITKPFDRQRFAVLATKDDGRYNISPAKLPDIGKVGQGTLLYYSNKKEIGNEC